MRIVISLLFSAAFVAIGAFAEPKNPTGPAYADLSALIDKADRQLALRRFWAAKLILEKACTDAERQFAKAPEMSTELLEPLSIAYRELGTIQEVVYGDFWQARADYEKSLHFLASIQPGDSVWFSREDLHRALLGWIARVNIAQGRLDDALATMRENSDMEEAAIVSPRRLRSVQREEFGGTGGLFGMKLENPVSCNIATTLAVEQKQRVEFVRNGLECVLRNKEREADITGFDTALLRVHFPREFEDYARFAGLATGYELDSWLSENRWITKLSPEQKVEAARKTTKLLGSASHLLLAASQQLSRSDFYQPSVTIEAVQKRIPSDAALIEFQAYRGFNPIATTANRRAMWLRPRYVAYLLRPFGEPKILDLGRCRDIDHLVEHFRFLMDPHMSPDEISRTATELESVVMAPLRKMAPDVRTFLISPDGMLDLLPFEALVDSDRKYLVETLVFHYLTSGRDLLKTTSTQLAHSPPVFVGYPCFDDERTSGNGFQSDCEMPSTMYKERTAPQSGMRAWNLHSNRFELRDIASTLSEVSEVAQEFPGSTLLVKAAATEEAVKSVAGPAILHLATHGFFLRSSIVENERKVLDDDTVTTFGVGIEDPPVGTAQKDSDTLSPLVRSGLALSGANRLHSGAENDGILTAFEASTLNLSGTQLVTLSACETGLTDPSYGGSVTGMRRAFSIAGALTEVVSLWSVNDDSTRELMKTFYQDLRADESVSDALRSAQLTMLRGKNHAWRHPYYWAGFQSSGALSRLSVLVSSSPTSYNYLAAGMGFDRSRCRNCSRSYVVFRQN